MRSEAAEVRAIKSGPCWKIKRRTRLSRDNVSPTIEKPFYSQNYYYYYYQDLVIFEQTDEEVSVPRSSRLLISGSHAKQRFKLIRRWDPAEGGDKYSFQVQWFSDLKWSLCVSLVGTFFVCSLIPINFSVFISQLKVRESLKGRCLSIVCSQESSSWTSFRSSTNEEATELAQTGRVERTHKDLQELS